jgi:hypothetical protein
VRAPDDVRTSHGIFAWSIGYAEVERLLRRLWPSHLAKVKRIADQRHGGDLSRVQTGWRHDLEAALDREAEARRDFGRRCEKWKKQRQWSEELRRRRMPPEERRALECKEHNERMKALSAKYDEREKASAALALMKLRGHVRPGRTAHYQHLLADIADIGPVGVTASDVCYIVAAHGAHLLAPEQRERWGREIAGALVVAGVLVARSPDRFVLQENAAELHDIAGEYSEDHQSQMEWRDP